MIPFPQPTDPELFFLVHLFRQHHVRVIRIAPENKVVNIKKQHGGQRGCLSIFDLIFKADKPKADSVFFVHCLKRCRGSPPNWPAGWYAAWLCHPSSLERGCKFPHQSGCLFPTAADWSQTWQKPRSVAGSFDLGLHVNYTRSHQLKRFFYGRWERGMTDWD